MSAILALEDGRVFSGEAFGASTTATGEVCFNTSMSGYQEVLTDPSYRGQIVAMTYPLIGNYGTNSLDNESGTPHVRGFVVEEVSPVVSNWRSEESLEQFMKRHGIPGIQGVDTRALTKHLRVRGAMRSCLTSELSESEAVEAARNCEGVAGVDLVREVTAEKPYRWDPEGAASAEWTVYKEVVDQDAELDAMGNAFAPLPDVAYRIVAVDCGMKRNILRRFRQNGFQVDVVPATATPDEILASDPDGVFLSNGPGDPAALPYLHETVRELVGRKPLFGICLGHQVLGCALGAKTFKLKFGHRGGNQPVKDLRTGKVSITSQNHGFAIEADSLPDHVEVTHVNLNDQTVAGLRHREAPAFGVQYHPEAAPGPHDASYFFRDFAKEIEASRGAH